MAAETATPTPTVTDLTPLTYEMLDNLVILWQERTKTEDAKAIAAHNLIDALLDVRTWATTYDEIVAEQAA